MREDKMKNKFLLVTVFLGVGFFIFLPVFMITGNPTLEAITISFGVTLYHFVMRLLVGALLKGIMKNKADHTRIWFRERRYEKGLYRRMRVQRWQKYIPTFDPDTFDTRKRTVKEILGATCQAEICHEVFMLLGLLPIASIPLLGGAAAMVITSVLAMLTELPFVVVQRYNRPRFVRVMGRFEKIK